jgi:hypothetical protein
MLKSWVNRLLCRAALTWMEMKEALGIESSNPGSKPRTPSRGALRVEGLEERWTPVTISNVWQYAGAGAGDWDTVTNWSLGHVPTTTEDAIFLNTSSQQSCVCNSSPTVGSLQIVGGYTGKVTLNKGITLSNGGQLASGTIDQPNGATSDITVQSGVFLFTGGTLNSTATRSTIHIGANATLNMYQTASDSGTIGDNIDNSGTINDQAGAAYTFTNNAGITNNTTGQIYLIQGDLRTSGTGQIANSGLLSKTVDTSGIVVSQLAINNVDANAVLAVQNGTLWVQATSATTGVSVSQTLGTVKLGLTQDSGDTAGTLKTDAGFTMNGGSLKSYGSFTSAIRGNVVIHGGDIYVRADSSSTTAQLDLANVGKTFTMDGGVYHAAVNADGTNADLITTAGTAVIGGTAQIAPLILNGSVADGASYTVLYAAGGVTGNFSYSGGPLDPIWTPHSDADELYITYGS